MARITKFLETKANQLEKSLDRDIWDISIPSMIKREIALTVEQIDRQQKLYEDQLSKLLQAECCINTELIQMEDRTPRYATHRFPEREKFLRSLLGIEAERRKLTTHLEEKTRSLEDHLLSLINKHEQITLDHEH